MDNRKEVAASIGRIEKQLTKLFGDTYTGVVQLAAVRNAIESGDTFTWDGNPAASKALEKSLTQLSRATQVLIKGGITTSWDKGEENVTNTLYAAFGKTPARKQAIGAIGERARNDMRERGATASAFYTRQHNGLNISSRVWNNTGTAQQELEAIIQNGILEGKSADQISRSIKGYLNEPSRIFRSVRNKETGNLELSSAAKKYHPGQGVYRSSYKNALRLARTEINAAYRRAEWESYQSNPLIIGYRIELSNNHTTTVKGKVRPLTDICDRMVGSYPKTFLWTGWHPQCRCRMIPIFISDSDFGKRIKALASGKLQEWKASNTVTELPKGFSEWIKENKKRIDNAKAVPYWIRDNYTGGEIAKGLKKEISSLEAQVQKSKEPITTFDDEIGSLRRWASALGGDLTQIDILRYGGDEQALKAEVERVSSYMLDRRADWLAAGSDLYSYANTELADYPELSKKYKAIKEANQCDKSRVYSTAIATLKQALANAKVEFAKAKAEADKKRAEAVKEEPLDDYYQRIDSAATMQKVKLHLAAQLEKTMGYKVVLSISERDIPIEIAKGYAKEIAKLCTTYKLEQASFKKLTFRNLASCYGRVAYKRTWNTELQRGEVHKEMTVGSNVATTRASNIATDKSRCDSDRLQYSTLTHEFGHNIITNAIQLDPKGTSFWRELQAIRADYYKELSSCRRTDVYDDIYLGAYADSTASEFIAEAFQEYINKKTPSKYARLVGELVDKYYKK